MYSFARFMNSKLGRGTRIIGGGTLIVAGLAIVGGIPGALVAALGLVPLAAGALDLCLLAPFLRTPFSGKKVRAILRTRQG